MNHELITLFSYIIVAIVGLFMGRKMGHMEGFAEGHKTGWHAAWKRKEQIDQGQKDEAAK